MIRRRKITKDNNHVLSCRILKFVFFNFYEMDDLSLYSLLYKVVQSPLAWISHEKKPCQKMKLLQLLSPSFHLKYPHCCQLLMKGFGYTWELSLKNPMFGPFCRCDQSKNNNSYFLISSQSSLLQNQVAYQCNHVFFYSLNGVVEFQLVPKFFLKDRFQLS